MCLKFSYENFILKLITKTNVYRSMDKDYDDSFYF